MLAYPYVHPIRDASKSRNGYVHPMTSFLLATLLTCEEAKGFIQKIKPSEEMRTELVEVLKQSTKKGCDWDAND